MRIAYFKTKIYDIGEGHVEWNNQIGRQKWLPLFKLVKNHLCYPCA